MASLGGSTLGHSRSAPCRLGRGRRSLAAPHRAVSAGSVVHGKTCSSGREGAAAACARPPPCPQHKAWRVWRVLIKHAGNANGRITNGRVGQATPINNGCKVSGLGI